MTFRKPQLQSNPNKQRGVSLLVAIVILVILTLIGVSSMDTAVMELRMAGSLQQQGLARNRADEVLYVGEQNIKTITETAGMFDFTADDGYYEEDDSINVYALDWDDSGLKSIDGPVANSAYVVEYMGPQDVVGESISEGGEVVVTGGQVYSFRFTSRSMASKNAVRLVQSVYVTADAP